MTIDTIIFIVVSMIMMVFCITREKVSKFEGSTCIVIYVAYMAYVILRTIA